MRILFAGNGNIKHKGARYYDPGRKLHNGLLRNGHNVFWMSDRDIARSGSFLGLKSLGFKHANEYFISTCKNFLPDLIVLYHADIIAAESVAEARKILPGVKITQFNVDPIFREHNMKMIRAKLPYVDSTFITTAGKGLKRFSGPNGFVAFVPNLVDASIDWPRCHEHSEQEYDVFWAMRNSNGKTVVDRRVTIPLFIENSGKVTIDYYGMNGKPELYNADYYNKISACKMGLNISVNRTWDNTPIASPEELYLYSSDRITHYMGSGLLTFNTRENSLHELFEEDKEMVFFDSAEELLDKLLYYKNNDNARKVIAGAGWQKQHNSYNERLIAKYIVESTFGQKYTENYLWPTDKY
jgi:hypothetical protein